MRIKTDTQNMGPRHRLAEIVIETDRRWVRLVAVFGEPPGSRIGLWHTNTGTVHGWNLRIGKRYVKTLTLMAHTRPTR